MRIEPNQTELVLIDVQERLAKAMDQERLARVLKRSELLIRATRELGVRQTVTEQYPEGLGATVPALTNVLGPDVSPLTKSSFSCCGAQSFQKVLDVHKPLHAILFGMEAHVCVFQTCSDLLDQGVDVWVAEDAVISRRLEHEQAGLRLMSEAGAIVAPVETILFSLMGASDISPFKAVSKLVKELG